MNYNVSHSLKSPLYRIKVEILNQEYTVYYVGTNNGRIYKIVQYYRNLESKSKLLDIFEIAQNEAIQVMEISQSRKSLYVATDHRIKQIDLAMCNRRYDNCFRCVKDPYCGWDKDTGTCKPYELGLLQVRSNIGKPGAKIRKLYQNSKKIHLSTFPKIKTHTILDILKFNELPYVTN